LDIKNNIDINVTCQEASGLHMLISMYWAGNQPVGRKSMLREKTRVGAVAVKSIALAFMLGAALHAIAQDAQAAYPSMAPLEQYLVEDRSSEIALARSAAPDSISRDAEVMVLGRHGYESAIKGTNGFVCLVERSWTAPR
jgi:hypothetical protein